MCLKGPKDNSAQIAADNRRREEERQARIREGQAAIDEQFGQFDDTFFQGVEQSALDFFNPQLDEQFRRARDQVTFNLARSGNLNASEGARQFGDLTRTLQENRALIADRAAGDAARARADVESNRSDLIGQLSASADPSAAATGALARAQSLAAPRQFSPLGDLFAAAIRQGGDHIRARREFGEGFPPSVFPQPKKGSQTIVN